MGEQLFFEGKPPFLGHVVWRKPQFVGIMFLFSGGGLLLFFLVNYHVLGDTRHLFGERNRYSFCGDPSKKYVFDKVAENNENPPPQKKKGELILGKFEDKFGLEQKATTQPTQGKR